MLITPILADAGPSRLTGKSRAQLSFLLVVCLCPALKVLARVPTVPKRATLTLHYLRDITKASHDSGSARVAVGEAASAGGGRWVQHPHYLSPLGLVWLGAKVGIYSLQISDFTALFLLHFLPHDCVCIEKLRPRPPLGIQSSALLQHLQRLLSAIPARVPVHAGSAGSAAPFHTACCCCLCCLCCCCCCLCCLSL
ncbi:hypothetical protein V8E51_018332 [Hyaloscypha variabilis]